MKNIIRFTLIAVVVLFNVGCTVFDDFLDTTPDNRTEADTPEKIAMLLVKAYAWEVPNLMAEYSSDNVDKRHLGPSITTNESTYANIAMWEDCQEEPEDSPNDFWEESYMAIAHANEALVSIEELGNTEEVLPFKGEALLCRAYQHFMLVNIFGMHYDVQTCETDLGIPYMEAPETEVNPHYVRESVKSTYDKIERDLLEGLPLIDDNAYSKPKFHFNKKAAYAFATRFYLYKGDYDKVIQYANLVLGDDPRAMMRDMSAYPVTGVQAGTIPNDFEELARWYASPNQTANLLMVAISTRMNYVFQNYPSGKWYCTSPLIAEHEIQKCTGPWGSWTNTTFYPYIWTSSSSSTSSPVYVFIPKVPGYEVETAPGSGSYNFRSQIPLFTSGEVLLSRAEAYLMKQDYVKALADLALWMKTWCTPRVPALTEATIEEHYGKNVPYWTPETPTLRKQLGIQLADERQEEYMHCCLHFRRIQTLHDGLRWYDVKRLKINIVRRSIDANNNVVVVRSLDAKDPRRAIQLPKDVIAAGLEANPR